jgi:hypothetical protein
MTESTTLVTLIDGQNKIYMPLWKKIFQHRSSANVWCDVIDDQLTGSVILEHRGT